MPGGLSLKTVAEVILMVIVLVVVVVFGVPMIQKVFAEILGQGDYVQNIFAKSVACSYFRCKEGCLSGSVSDISWKIGTADYSCYDDFCEKVPNLFRTKEPTGNNYKICENNAKQYPVELDVEFPIAIDKTTLGDEIAHCIAKQISSGAFENFAQSIVALDAEVVRNLKSIAEEKCKIAPITEMGVGELDAIKSADLQPSVGKLYIGTTTKFPLVTEVTNKPAYTILTFSDIQGKTGSKTDWISVPESKSIGGDECEPVGLRFDIADVLTKHLIFESSITDTVDVSVDGSKSTVKCDATVKETIFSISGGKGSLHLDIRCGPGGFDVCAKKTDVRLSYNRIFTPLFLSTARESYTSADTVTFDVFFYNENGPIKQEKVRIDLIKADNTASIIGECQTNDDGTCSVQKQASQLPLGLTEFGLMEFQAIAPADQPYAKYKSDSLLLTIA